MAALRRNQEKFDFSKDAQKFMQDLLQQLREKVSASAFEPVEDQALEWVNAAGSPHMPPEDEKRCDGQAFRPID